MKNQLETLENLEIIAREYGYEVVYDNSDIFKNSNVNHGKITIGLNISEGTHLLSDKTIKLNDLAKRLVLSHEVGHIKTLPSLDCYQYDQVGYEIKAWKAALQNLELTEETRIFFEIAQDCILNYVLGEVYNTDIPEEFTKIHNKNIIQLCNRDK